VDEEFNDFAIEQLQTMGAIIFGRVTYEGMASYWPTEVALANDAVVAGQMNSMPKIVFSKTLGKAYWSHTTLIKGDLAQEYVARHFSGMSRSGHSRRGHSQNGHFGRLCWRILCQAPFVAKTGEKVSYCAKAMP
jgi:hypothetical protein